jgi:hypothetical protein
MAPSWWFRRTFALVEWLRYSQVHVPRPLLNYPVCLEQYRYRNGQTHLPCRAQVDHQLELQMRDDEVRKPLDLSQDSAKFWLHLERLRSLYGQAF